MGRNSDEEAEQRMGRARLWDIHAGKEKDQPSRAGGSLGGKTGHIVWD